MRLPSNVRSLFAFGVFCALGGAWLTLVTEVRTWPLRADSLAAHGAPEVIIDLRDAHSKTIENAPGAREMMKSVR